MDAKQLECGDSLEDDSLLSLCFHHPIHPYDPVTNAP